MTTRYMLTVRRVNVAHSITKDYIQLYPRSYATKDEAFTAAARLLTGKDARQVVA